MEKTINITDLQEVINEAINKSFNNLCQKNIIDGDKSEEIYSEMINYGLLYMTAVVDLLKEKGIEIK